MWATLLMLLCLFPYLTPIRTHFDTQPYAVALSVGALMHFATGRNRFTVPLALLPLGAAGLVALALLCSSGVTSDSLRPVVGYVSAFLIALASYHGFPMLKASAFVSAVFIWLAVGLVQRFAYRQFGDVVLSRMSTTADRGNTSLAVEPSFYAVMCIFFFLMNDVLAARRHYGPRMHLVIFVVVTFQLALASSALGFILFVAYFVTKMITLGRRLALLKLVIFAAALAGILALLQASLPAFAKTRFGRLTGVAVHHPLNLVSSDASISDRVFAVLVSHTSVISSHGIGYGLDAWSANAASIARAHPFIQQFTGARSTVRDSIMSGWGAGLFQLGVLGLLPLISLVALIISARRASSPPLRAVVTCTGITVYVVMLMAVPFAFPMFGFMLGVLGRLGDADAATPQAVLPQSEVTSRPRSPGLVASRPGSVRPRGLVLHSHAKRR